MLTRLVRRGVEQALRWRGYELKQIGTPVRGFTASLEYAKSRGLSPRTVFDVGVGHGTPWLYEAFPDAKLVLFEPLAVFKTDLSSIREHYRADVHHVALSNEVGRAPFNLNTEAPTSSSLLELDPRYQCLAAHVDYEPHAVQLDKLDRLNNYEPPYLLKLDVEGAELRVLEGATKTLRGTDFLIAEISVMRRTRGEPAFARLVSYLDECGFALFDLPSLTQAKGNGQLVYLDAAFAKKDGSLWP